MYGDSDFVLKPSEKMDILYRLSNGEKVGHLIDEMDNQSVIGLQKFIWEKTAEFGIICHRKNFTRKSITRKMTPTPKYQQRQNCNERVYNCKGTQCIHSNSKCARQKIREHVDVMAESIHECIRIGQRNEILQ